MLDSERLSRLTTWTSEKGPKLDNLLVTDTHLENDNIALLLDSSVCSNVIYIGVYNTKPARNEVEFSI